MPTLFANSPLFQKLKQPWLVSLTLVVLLSIWLGLGVGQAEEAPEKRRQKFRWLRFPFKHSLHHRPLKRLISMDERRPTGMPDWERKSQVRSSD